jgi:thioredoxin reductase (NADPH)
MASLNKHDVVIIGGGPAGLTAGIYSSRAGLDALLIEKEMVGGQIANAARVENFPGFPCGISGAELAERLERQAKNQGANIAYAEVTQLQIQGRELIVETSGGDKLSALAVIICCGMKRRKLSVPGEEELTGRGVSYCATCDGPLFSGKRVAVVGGGDVALSDTLFLAGPCSQVSVIHRRDELRAIDALQKKALAHPRVDFVLSAVVTEIYGKEKVEEIKLLNTKTREPSSLKVDGVFIAIGQDPRTEFLRGVLPLDDQGYIEVDELMKTRTPGIFAAGDIRSQSIKQAVAACGDGAVAALSAQRYILQSLDFPG